MPLVEIVRRPGRTRTSSTACGVGRRLGKTPVFVKDSPGFVVNRILVPYLNEAVLLVYEGMRVQRIDEALAAFGMRWGRWRCSTQVGLERAAGHRPVAGAGVRGPLGRTRPSRR